MTEENNQHPENKPNEEILENDENNWERNHDWHNAVDAENHEEFSNVEVNEPALKAKRGIATVLVAGILGGVIGSAGTYFAVAELTNGKLTTVELNQAAAEDSARPDGSIAALAAAVTPAVVSIEASNSLGSATGSGFIIDANGYIVTNNHVIANAAYNSKIVVTLADGQEFRARLVGQTFEYDLAVLKIQATGLPVVELGNSDGVVVGDTVIAIGSPLGLQSTVTSGIVSALDRPVTTGDNESELSFIEAIQTDAAINPGNSGGPLIDAKGRVIGVNSAIATNTTNKSEAGSIGLGFAIPVNLVARVAQEIIDNGEATVPVMGVKLNIQSAIEGAVIVGITKNGPADKAGLKKGDIIVQADGRVIHNDAELVIVIRSKNPGDVVVVETKDGNEYSVTLTSKDW